MFSLFIAVALAEVPDTVRPIAATADALEQYREWSAREGRKDELVCTPIVDAIVVCFTVTGGGKLRWVGENDLARWDVSRAAFDKTMGHRAGVALSLESQSPEAGLSYWVGAGDRWEVAGLLRPDALVARTVESGEVRVAVPLERTLIVWRPGSKERDRILAIGAAEMAKTQEAPVSPLVLRWDGRWTVFGQAVEGDEAEPR